MNKLTDCLTKKKSSCIPIWFMRQAGRYLPEFQQIRKKNPNFINLCLNSNLSSEITMQPIKRYDLDAAIIFSDILMVPYALKQKVSFIKDEGPILSSFNIENFLETNEKDFTNKLNPIYDSIKKTRKDLNDNKSLISFVGSPWTLIVYMLGLKKEKNILDLEILNSKKKEIKIILEKINYFLTSHIQNQINAGADVVQLFDSWAGLIPKKDLNDYCYKPNLKIVNFCKEKKIPVICLPKGLNENYLEFLKIVNPDGLNIDFNIDPHWARKHLDNVTIQGGMDPKILLQGNEKIFEEAEKYIKIFKGSPYIFNLGHGLLPQTNPDRVKELVNFIRNYE